MPTSQMTLDNWFHQMLDVLTKQNELTALLTLAVRDAFCEIDLTLQAIVQGLD